MRWMAMVLAAGALSCNPPIRTCDDGLDCEDCLSISGCSYTAETCNETCLQDAFATDVRPAVREWREAHGLPLDPLEAFRQGGYLERITDERAHGRQAPSGATLGSGF